MDQKLQEVLLSLRTRDINNFMINSPVTVIPAKAGICSQIIHPRLIHKKNKLIKDNIFFLHQNSCNSYPQLIQTNQ
jgi:hypothetical protein